MAKYHVNPKTGRPSACGAVNRCPFGNEDSHYPSREEAQAAYEKQQRTREVPKPARKAQDGNEGIRQRDLRVAARDSQDASFLAKAAEEGDEGVMREVASNAHSPHAALTTAHGRTQNEKTKKLLEEHGNFAKKSYTLKEINELIATPSRHRELATFIEGHATDRMVKSISEGVGVDSPLQRVILTSPNRQISHETKAQALRALALQTPGRIPAEVAASKNFPVKDFVGDMDERQREWVAREAKQPETMSALTAVVERDLSASDSADAHELAIKVYRNEATNDRDKRRLREASYDAASYHKLQEAKATRFPEYSDIRYKSDSQERALAAGERENFSFSAAAMRDLNFGENEIKVYLQEERRVELYDVSWDAETGVFSGTRLFGDPDA